PLSPVRGPGGGGGASAFGAGGLSSGAGSSAPGTLAGAGGTLQAATGGPALVSTSGTTSVLIPAVSSTDGAGGALTTRIGSGGAAGAGGAGGSAGLKWLSRN